MIRLNDVTFSYPGSEDPVFENFSISVDPCSMALFGPAGAGKSTLAKLMKGLVRPQSGSVEVDGDPAVIIGYLGGDPYDTLVGVTVEDDVAFGLENLGVESEEIRRRVSLSLEWTGLAGFEKRLTHQLSGGEQQKVALAAQLALGVKLLILDDVMPALDRGARKSILSLLDRLRSDHGLCALHIRSDNPLEALCVDRALFLSAGRIVFDGTAREFVTSSLGREWISMAGGMAGLAMRLLELGIVDIDDLICADPTTAIRDKLDIKLVSLHK